MLPGGLTAEGRPHTLPPRPDCPTDGGRKKRERQRRRETGARAVFHTATLAGIPDMLCERCAGPGLPGGGPIPAIAAAPCRVVCMELEPKRPQGEGRRALHSPRVPGLSPGTKDVGRSDRRQRPCNCVLDTEAPRIQRDLDTGTRIQSSSPLSGHRGRNGRTREPRPQRRKGGSEGRTPDAATPPSAGGRHLPCKTRQGGGRRRRARRQQREAARAGRGTARTPQRTEMLKVAGPPMRQN